MDISISDPTNADPMSVSGDVEFNSDDTECTITLGIDSPIYSRLQMSGLRKYRVDMETGPDVWWTGDITRWTIGGNRVYLYCMGQLFIPVKAY